MSKSKGTFYTARELFDKVIDGVKIEPAAVRLELIKTHYRSNADFSFKGLKESAERLVRIRRAARTMMWLQDKREQAPYDICAPGSPVIRRIGRFLMQDLNVSGALATLDEELRGGFIPGVLSQASTIDDAVKSIQETQAAIGREVDQIQLPPEPLPLATAMKMTDSSNYAESGLGRLHLIDNILGVIFRPEANPKSTETSIGLFKGVDPDPEIESLLTKRAEARKAKDFAQADAIRDELAARGLAIKDAPGGKVEVTRA